MESKKRIFDVALSFAGEDRAYVEEVAKCLKAAKINVFYDRYEEATLWGTNLYDHLQDVYRNQSRYCIMFISENYAKKLWTNHERQAAQSRAFEENREYILPVKLDDTEISGVLLTQGYVDGRKKNPQDICNLLLIKLEKVKNYPDSDLNNDEDDENIIVPKIKRTITDLEKKKFLIASFQQLQAFFEKGLKKLEKTNNHISTELETINTSKFIATIYVEGELRSQCKLWIGGTFGQNSISFAQSSRALDIQNDYSMNDSATVADDGMEIYFEILGMMFGMVSSLENINLKHASPQEVARYFWGRVINNLDY